MEMRYYVEVTEAEALALETEGKARVVSGASGNGAHPDMGGPNVPWMLLRTNDVEKQRVDKQS